jgi:hypothetical protein
VSEDTTSVHWLLIVFSELKVQLIQGKLRLLLVKAASNVASSYPLWLWGHSFFKISPPGPPFYGTKWLPWHPHKSDTTLHPKCGAVGGVKWRGKHNRSRKVPVHGPIWTSPLFNQSINQRCFLPASWSFLTWVTLQPWRWWRHLPPKRL